MAVSTQPLVFPSERPASDFKHLIIDIIFHDRHNHQVNISDNYVSLVLLMIINN